MNKIVLIIARYWQVSSLPLQHVFIAPKDRPKGVKSVARVYFRKWLVHPIKRRVAKYYLLFLQKFCGLKVIGITGSAGKTTTKEMLGNILKQKGETIISFANIDPVYNIPTTVLKCRPSTKYLVLEMGIEFPGEMDFYTWLANPDIGICTAVFMTHTLFLGSIDGVKKEKSKLIKNLSKNASAILNYDDPRVNAMANDTTAQVVWYGMSNEALVRAKNIKFAKDFTTKFKLIIDSEKAEVEIPIVGKHFVSLALAACAAAYQLGFSLKQIKRGLEKFSPPAQRMFPIKLSNGSIVINDSYNANPSATKASLDVLQALGAKKEKIFVFGEMKELGKYESKAHAEIGEYAAKLGIKYIFGVGELVKNTIASAKRAGVSSNNLFLARDNDELAKHLAKIITPNQVILVKGSRSMKMEEVVEKIQTA